MGRAVRLNIGAVDGRAFGDRAGPRERLAFGQTGLDLWLFLLQKGEILERPTDRGVRFDP